MRIKLPDCIFIVIDVQEKLLPHMLNTQKLIRNFKILLEGFQIMGVPIISTQQYPTGLGITIPEINEKLDSPAIDKITFSCCDENKFMVNLQHTGKKTFILSGIETHICVQQTAIDLSSEGYQTVIVADCVSSRQSIDHNIAIQRMRSEGSTITTCESILFELCRSAQASYFKNLSLLIKSN